MIRRKFGNKPTNGFASGREAKRAFELQLLERAGEITDLNLQVPFEVIPACPPERAAVYVADFTYRKNGALVVEDAKGMKTPVYVLKRKLMRHVHGITILES